MARSRRKRPIAGITMASSEKWEKRKANRRIRRRVKESLAADPEAEVLPHRRELSSVWAMGKDGKRWYDPYRFAEISRK